MIKIGEFSKLVQVPVKTLRYYDELGLFRPEWVDRYTGYRYYSLQQIPRLNRILALKELGFALVQIEQLLAEDHSLEELQRLMRLRQAELEHEAHEQQAQLTRIATRLRLIEQEGRPPRYDVLLKPLPTSLVAGIRTTLAAYHEIGALVGELQGFLQGQGIAPSLQAPLTAIYYDAEYKEQGADVEVAVPVKRPLRTQGRIVVHELPGAATAATLVHPGSYDRLPEAYRSLMAWSQANGYRIAAPSRELYLQGYADGVSPDHFVTELQLPVHAPARSITRAVPNGEKEHPMLEPRIVGKPAFTVVGLPFTGFVSSSPFEGSDQNNEIGKAWDEFNRRVGEIPHISGPVYGVCFAMPNDKEPWYIAGIEVTRAEDVPAGMMSMTVPAQRYAVFPCTLETLGATYRYITEEWQPQSGYTHAAGPDFECYDQDFDPANPRAMKLSVYWPIQ
jgi:predicted transcriptional regulator YdeE